MVKTYIKERPVQEGGVDLLGTVKLGADAPRKEVDVDDEDSFLVKFKNGAVGSIEATRNAWGRNNFITIELHGTKGSIAFNYEVGYRVERVCDAVMRSAQDKAWMKVED